MKIDINNLKNKTIKILEEISKGLEETHELLGYKAYKRSLNVVNKKIQDLTQAPPSSPNLDAYSNSHSVS